MPIELNAARLEKAQEIFVTAVQRMNTSEFFELMSGLGWFDAVSYNAEGKVELALEDIQKVGLAAAMVAYMEAKGNWP